MSTYTKIDGVAAADILKVSGVGAVDIMKVSGVSKPTDATATRWMAGAAQGKIFQCDNANASATGDGWFEADDVGAGNLKGIAFGEDAAGNKQWYVHSTNTAQELSYAAYGSEDDWTNINVGDNYGAVDGGPSLAWGNGYWVCATDDFGSDEIVIIASGSADWAAIDVGNTTNDTGRAAAYKDGTTFFMSVQDQIWKTTADPAVPGNWSLEVDLADSQDILAMAYDGSGTWVCVGANGEVHSSDDDWATATPRTGQHGSDTIRGVVYCGGTVNKWIAVGNSGKISHSPDGTTWTAVPSSGTAVALQAIATDNTTIVAVGASGTILTSTDAVNWSTVTTSFSTTLFSVACDIIGSGMR